jgi:hypothetical protein
VNGKKRRSSTKDEKTRKKTSRPKSSQRLARESSMRVRVSALWDQVASRLGPGNVDIEAAQRAVLRAAGYAWCVPLPRAFRVACLASRSRHETTR